jgi:hypothetical protein
MMSRSRWPVTILTAAAVIAGGAIVRSHDGPPFPIVSNRIVGAYDISIWTDPDTTDDSKPGGQFWVLVAAADRGAALPAGTRVRVAIRPLDREGPVQESTAEPVNGAVTRQFVALVMDHEGPFGVRATVDGPLGRAEVEGRVDATYDLRPARWLIAVYLLPFLALGALWMKVLNRRRQSRNPTAR